jgi:hypothetical protein
MACLQQRKHRKWLWCLKLEGNYNIKMGLKGAGFQNTDAINLLQCMFSLKALTNKFQN